MCPVTIIGRLLSFQFLEIKLAQLISHFRLNHVYSTTLAAHIKRYNKQLQNFKSHFCLYCPPPFRRKVEGHSFRLSVLPSFHPSFLPSVRPSAFRPSVPLKYYVPCVRNSSYSFMAILLELYSCFCHGLKICMWFGYYPEIIFCHFFGNLNLVIF